MPNSLNMNTAGKAGATFRMRCLCGKEAAVAVRSIGRPTTCGGCHARYVPVWGIDPKTKSAALITFDAAPTSPRGFKIPAGVYELPCPCGQSLFARPRQAGKRVQCPVCSNWMKLEHSKDPQTLETRIRVLKSRLNQLPALPPPPPPPPATPITILCSCGETLRVESTDSVSQARCGVCGRHIRLEMNEGSVSSCIVVDPQTPDPAPPPEKKGIDEELSLDDFT
jgi:hypothetical protein